MHRSEILEYIEIQYGVGRTKRLYRLLTRKMYVIYATQPLQAYPGSLAFILHAGSYLAQNGRHTSIHPYPSVHPVIVQNNMELHTLEQHFLAYRSYNDSANDTCASI
jgi:hypothetical protein